MARIKRQRTMKMIRKAADLHRLQPGWYFGRGLSIDGEAIGYAIWFIKTAETEGVWKSNVFPRVEGGVRVDLIQDGHEIEISIDPDGTCSISHEYMGESLVTEDELTFTDTAALLRASAKRVCTSEHLAHTISTSKRTGLAPKPASRLPMVASLSSGKIVRWVGLGASQSIFEVSMPLSRRSPQFFGGSTTQMRHGMSIGTSKSAKGTRTLVM